MLFKISGVFKERFQDKALQKRNIKLSGAFSFFKRQQQHSFGQKQAHCREMPAPGSNFGAEAGQIKIFQAAALCNMKIFIYIFNQKFKLLSAKPGKETVKGQDDQAGILQGNEDGEDISAARAALQAAFS